MKQSLNSYIIKLRLDERRLIMKTTSFIYEIKSLYPKLTKTEKKVADYVLENTKKVIYLSILELAEECKVGDTSVYRFCRSIGLKGYQEFKLRLSLSLSEDPPKQEVAPESVKDYANSIYKKYERVLFESSNLVLEEQISLVVDEMLNAEKIYFFGVGNSGTAAMDARNIFARVTNKVQYVADAHVQVLFANMMTSKDLIILFSFSGETEENVDIAKIAKGAGAKVVCVTRYEQSPLAQCSDLVILCGKYEKEVQGGRASMGARIAQMFTIELIYEYYYAKNKAECDRIIKQTDDAIFRKLY